MTLAAYSPEKAGVGGSIPTLATILIVGNYSILLHYGFPLGFVSDE